MANKTAKKVVAPPIFVTKEFDDGASFSVGNFSFDLVENIEPPAKPVSAAKGNAAHPLPFASWFPRMKHNAMVFIPDSFWTAPRSEGGRAIDFSKHKTEVKMGEWVPRKMRDIFAAWRDEVNPETGKPNDAPDGPAYDKVLVVHYREKGSAMANGGTYEEPGVSIWVNDALGHTADRKALLARRLKK